jgi:hypothetical protein
MQESGTAIQVAGNIQVRGDWNTTYPVYQLLDTRSGGAEWNIENGRTLGNLSFYNGAAGGTKMTLSTLGNLSIGNTNNTYKLDVTGTGNFTGELFVRGNASAYTTHTFTTGASNVALYDQLNASGTVINRFNAGGNSYINGGNLGLGTTSPGAKLDVRGRTNIWGGGTTSATLGLAVLDSPGNNYSFYVEDNGGAFLRGNVRIGNSTDNGYKLDVDGTFRASGAATFSSSVTATSFRVNTNGSGITFTNTGGSASGQVYQTGADYLALLSGGSGIQFKASSGANLVTLTDAGNLGIGTTSPSAALEIYTLNDPTAILRAFGDFNVHFRGQTNGLTQLFSIRNSSTNAVFLNTQNSVPLAFGVSTGSTGGSTVQQMLLNSSGNLGLGVTPSAWGTTSYKAIQGNYGTSYAFDQNVPTAHIVSNAYNNGTNWIYQINAPASRYAVNGWTSEHIWYTAPSGTAGNAISFTQAMTLNANGKLLVNTTADSGNYIIQANGNIASINSSASGLFSISGTRSIGAQSFAGDWNYLRSNGANLVLGTQDASNFYLRTNDVDRLTIASTGAATFSSTVWAQGAGSVTNPTIAVRNDDCGLYSPAINTLGFTVNSAERMRITSGGNVGIGTTAPVSNANRNTLALQGAWGGQLDIMVGSVVHAQFGTDNFNSGLSCRIQSQDGIVFNAGGATERMRITSGGQVYIGNTGGDGYRLQISGTTQAGATFGQTYIGVAAYSQWVTSTGAVAFGIDGAAGATERMRISSAGNLLIGTTTDSGFKLVVNGVNKFLPITTTPTWDTSTYFWMQDGFGTRYDGYQHRFDVGASRTQALVINTTGAATFSSSVTATSFFESSDKTIKTLITDNYSVNGIESITAKLYTKHGKEELGYFAQDVQGILPSAVTKGTNGLLNLSYREVLVAKVQSLEQRVKELETQLNLG